MLYNLYETRWVVSNKAIVIGGGIIGLLTAYMLAKEGVAVTLIEKNEAVGQEASWAAGGIISPLFPWRYVPAVTALSHYSQDHYQLLVNEVKSLSDFDPEFYVTGLYWLDIEDEQQALDWSDTYNRPLSKVDIAEVERAVSVLGDGYSSAIYMEGVANIRTPRFIRSLKLALAKLPTITLIKNCNFTGIIKQADRVIGVHTSIGDFYGDDVIICTGAWSGDLLKPLGIDIQVEPVKGQMILFKCAEDFLPTIILTKDRYAIPRMDGHILVGNTIEFVNYDKTPTTEILQTLQRSAIDLLPELAKANVIQHWAGLRPGSPDGVPYIGEVPNHKGLWLNCGHFRNGIVLAPASCQLLINLLQGRTPIVDPTPYLPANRLKA